MARERAERAPVLRNAGILSHDPVLVVESVEACRRSFGAESTGATGARGSRRGSRPVGGTAPIVVQVGRARVEVGADTDRDALSTVLAALAATSWGERS